MRVIVPASAPDAPAADAQRPPAPAPADADAAGRPAGRSLLDGALALLALALAFLLAFFPASNNDLWQHLAAGRLVAQGEFSFSTDPFSALEPAPRWVNFAWLSDLLLYALYQAGEGAALVTAKAVLVTLLAGVLLCIRRPASLPPVNDGGLSVPAVATILVLLALIPALVLRPTVVSYLLFAVLLLLLHRPPRRQSSVAGVSDPGPASQRPATGTPALWRLPLAVGVLFALWVNLDSGFLVGLLLLAVWLAGELLQRLAPLGPADPTDEPHTPAALALALAAALAGCLVSPYFFRTFSLPGEFVPLTLPEALRRDPLFEALFRSPFSRVWWLQSAGPAAALAYYLLLGLGLASFGLNATGWRWSRALAWAVLAWLSMVYWRLVPFFAVLAGPVLVLNVQSFIARRAGDPQAGTPAGPLSPAAAHTRAFLASAGRVLALGAGLALLALAWPGWLAPEALQSQRRVGWGTVTDPTLERIAKRLAGWYDASPALLDPRVARGFHLTPDFTYYCAWFCPREKGVFDFRLTAPVGVIADYARLRRDVLALAAPVRDEGDQPQPPDELLRKHDFTHLVVTGRPALEGGLARALFSEPWRWPPWAVEGRGLVVGWRGAGRRGPEPPPLDPVWQAVGAGVVKLPPPPEKLPPPPEPSPWRRFQAGATAAPPEAAESALWLVYRDTAVQRVGLAVPLWKLGTLIGRAAGPGAPDLTTAVLVDANAALLGPWLRSPDGRAGRAAAVLAVRAARRAVRASPDSYEGYQRLAWAYRAFDTDPSVGQLQQITALRGALERMPAAEAAGQFVAAEEGDIHQMLLELYGRATVPGSNRQPLDLLLESLDRRIELLPRVAFRTPVASADEFQARTKAVEAEIQRWQKQAQGLREAVSQSRDQLEASAAQAPPPRRAVLACQRGLAREALAALHDLDAQDLDPEAATYSMQLQVLHLKLHLLLLVGEAAAVREQLQSEKLTPLTVLPGDLQMSYRMLHIQTAAALGDYDAAIGHLAELGRPFLGAVILPMRQMLLSLIAPDAWPAHPLTRYLTAPHWGGLWQRNGQPAEYDGRLQVGALIPILLAQQQHADWQALSGLLALEQGDLARARQGLTQSLQTAGPSLNFNLRGVVQGWLELFPDNPPR